MLKIVVYFISLSLLWSKEPLPSKYYFNITQNKSAEVIIDKQQNIFSIVTKDKQIFLTNTSADFFFFLSNLEGITLFKFQDINFDGYTDIGMVSSIGYGGLNIYRDYFVYNPQRGKYEKVLENISELKINLEEKILFNFEHSGLSSFGDYYQINSLGKIDKIISFNAYWPEDESENMIRVYKSAAVYIEADRTYFYTHVGKEVPDFKKSTTYIVKGDEVKILDLLTSDKELWWVKVRYLGKKKYEKWIHFHDLKFSKIEENHE